MKKLLLVLGFLSAPAFSQSATITDAASAEDWGGVIGDIGAVASDVTKHAGAVLSDKAKELGGEISGTSHEANAEIKAATVTVIRSINDSVKAAAKLSNDPAGYMQGVARRAAEEYHGINPEGQRTDCTVVVAAACAYEASQIGGAFGAALGAGGGVALGHWACSAWYP